MKILPSPPGQRTRWYEHDGRSYVSVTSILDIINKPALVNWAANQERDDVVKVAGDLYDEIKKTAQKLPSKTDFKADLLRKLPLHRAHKRTLDTAANIGKEVHSYLEWWLKSRLKLPGVGVVAPKLSELCAGSVGMWGEWASTVDLTPEHIEAVVLKEDPPYAGTLDALCSLTIPKGCGWDEQVGLRVRAVCDWKTASGIWPEHLIQIAAYAKATDEPALWGVVTRIGKKTTNDFEWKLVGPEEMEVLYGAFTHAHALWTHVKTYEERGIAERAAKRAA